MKIVNLLVVIGLSLLGIVFAISNRQWVTLSVDPFSTIAVELPLFLIIAGAMLLGMVVGGMVTWFGQGNVRRNLKVAKKQEKELRKKVDQTPATTPPAEKTGLPAITPQVAAAPHPTAIAQK